MKKILSLLLCFTMMITTVHADAIANPPIWIIYDPVLLIGLIILVILLSIILKKLLNKGKK